MKTKEELLEYFKGDLFAMNMGAMIDSVSETGAVCSLSLNDGHRNARGAVMGGAIFTLADFAFAGGANSYGKRATAMSASITYMRPGTGKKLIAEAKEVSCGKKTCLFDVTVCNDEGKKIAKLLINGFLFEGEKLV